MKRHVDAVAAQARCGLLQVTAVAFHFFGFGKFQLIKISGNKPIGDVQKQQFRTKAFRQGGDMRKERGVSRAVFEGN
jgi:hypothetical protein